MTAPTLAFFGLPGWQELLIVLALALLLFGRRLPQTARSLGSAVVEFRKAITGSDDAPTEPQRKLPTR